jgi:hypothetical protein
VPVSSALLNGRTTYAATTNASGAAIVFFYPGNTSTVTNSNWAVLYNDVSLNVTTGVQAVNGIATVGPQAANSATIRLPKINKWSIKILDTLAQLTATGVITSCVYY